MQTSVDLIIVKGYCNIFLIHQTIYEISAITGYQPRIVMPLLIFLAIRSSPGMETHLRTFISRRQYFALNSLIIH